MEKEKNWVDYKKIKSAVTMEMALRHYDAFEPLNKVSGKNALGCCPIHQGTNPRQFSVCLSKNIWRCFGSCNTGGNVLDFISMMEGGLSIRDSALLLKNLLMDSKEDVQDETPQEDSKFEQTKNDPEPVIETKDEVNEEDTVNPPLNFTLKSLTADHPFFAENGIAPETVEYFSMGFCTKGVMKGRIAIPIHDHRGRLVAYCGRSVTDEQTEKEGKYKMPKNFNRSDVVYNLNRQKEDAGTLILVEDFISVIKLHQSGFHNVTALMASNPGKDQEKRILSYLGPSGRLILMFSTSEYSRKCADDCLSKFSSRMFVKKIDISPFAESPCQLTADQISSLI
jgi:DNA primase